MIYQLCVSAFKQWYIMTDFCIYYFLLLMKWDEVTMPRFQPFSFSANTLIFAGLLHRTVCQLILFIGDNPTFWIKKCVQGWMTAERIFFFCFSKMKLEFRGISDFDERVTDRWHSVLCGQKWPYNNVHKDSMVCILYSVIISKNLNCPTFLWCLPCSDFLLSLSSAILGGSDKNNFGAIYSVYTLPFTVP